MANRLARETSPYLLQHADNPVDWHPWGEEAFARARELDRPVLLSIGYSACHWCHVMERESFADAETARAMNEAFVSVKVDREERPDVDSVYMRAVQALTGHGGWPLTAFLTPAGAPFHGGTYFPPEPRRGMPSFRQVLAAAARAYRERPADVRRAGAELTAVVERSGAARRPSPGGSADGPPRDALSHAVAHATRNFDAVHGGFGGAPKFPQPDVLAFLLRTGGLTGKDDRRGVSMAVHTLTRMAAGGIRDHVGGGFHRYSVDARWHVPHFEKMLYDNALVAGAMVRAHVLGAPGLGRVAQETLDYVLADLTSPDGVFYSARDADSEGEEGAFYLWSAEEVRDALDPEAARLLARVHDVSDAGNFEGRNVLHLPHDLDAIARQEGVERPVLERALGESLAVLRARRASRPHPLRDEKVIASWNGLTIRTLAEAGPALGRPDYAAAAERAGAFLLDAMRKDERMFRVFAGGRVHIDGFLEDYGALGNACLSLYEATLEGRWLTEAEWFGEAVVDRFWTDDEAMFHDAPADGETLIVRPRDVMDNATPSGNSLATELLVRLAALTGSKRFDRVAGAVIDRERGAVESYPLGMGRLLDAILTRETEALEIALVGSGRSTAPMLEAAHRHPHPNRVIAGGDPADPAVARLPAMEGRIDRPGSAFVCVGGACFEPAASPGDLDKALERVETVRWTA